MNTKPIIIVSGEPYSVFFEIFFKAIKRYNYKKPIILISSKDVLLSQMKELNFKFKLNLIDKNNLHLNKINNKSINIINVDFKFKKTFDKISDKSNLFINECFEIALKILKNKECSGLINGPISKKNFLKEEFLGITEYLAHKTKKKNKVIMLIYNKKLAVSTTQKSERGRNIFQPNLIN